nr:Hpt domain-containing protein [Granulosicoccus sp.]
LDLHEARRLNLRAINRIGLAEKTGDLRLLQAVASDVLQVFAALDEHQHGKRTSTIFAEDFSAEAIGSAKLSGYQFKRIVDKCLAEAVVSLQSVQGDFLQVQEDHSRVHLLNEAAQRLQSIASALRILPLPEVGPLLEGCADYLLRIAESGEFPTERIAESFARLMVCMEFYLDPALQQQPAAAQLLLQADIALDELQESVPDFFDTDLTLNVASEDSGEGDREQANIHDTKLLDAFIGDALESLAALNKSLAGWKRTDRAMHLVDLRRHYHTLKGSAREAGATTLGALADANEQLLDAVIRDEVDDLNGAVMMRAEEARVLADQLDECIGIVPQLINLLPEQGEDLPQLDELFARLRQAASPEILDSLDMSATLATASEMDESIADITDALIIAASEDTGAEDSDWLEATIVTAPPPGAFTTGETHLDDSLKPLTELPADQTADLSLDATQLLAEEISGDETDSAELTLSMDNTLLKVFFTECQLHIGLLKEEIGDAFFASRLHLPTPVLQRSLHTLHGSARTADVPAVVELVAPLEQFAQKRMMLGAGMNRDETVIVSDAVLATEQIVEALADGREPPDVTAVQAQLDALLLAEAVDESASSGTTDLQGLFVEEAGELLSDIHLNVTSVRRSENQSEPIANITRSLHTLKGSARVAKFIAIADLTHALEGALERWKSDLPLSLAQLDGLQQAVDAITVNLDQARTGGELGQFDWLIAELDKDRRELDENEVTIAGPDFETSELSATQTVDVDDDTMVISSPFTNRTHPVELSASHLPANGSPALSESDQIRLDSSSVSRLSDLSTEVSVHHARMSEKFYKLRHTLTDLDKTTDRLRYKLRELQNESQMHNLSINNEAPRLVKPGGEVGEQDDSAITTDLDQDATTRFDPLDLEHYTKSREDARQLAELLSDFDSIRSTLHSQLADAESDASATARLDADIQQSLMRSRLVRFGQHADRLGSVVRQTASALNKQVDWALNGGELEIDRVVHKALGAALEHLIRNAITHGVESSDHRESLGKSPTGRVTLGVEFDGSDLLVTVTDDGAGIDLDDIRKRMEINAEASLSDQALLQKLFEAGFSTTEHTDDYAGRGVGLDVVAQVMTDLGGEASIVTDATEGTTVTLRIPQRVAINQVVLVDVADVTYGIPVNCVHTVQSVDAEDVEFDGGHYKCLQLATLLGVTDNPVSQSAQAVLIEAAGQKLALRVKDVPGYRELIARPLGSQLATLGCFSGGGILSSGQCVLILDVAALVAKPLRSNSPTPATESRVRTPEVLVVDDSVTMRTYASKILLKHGCRVSYARDGIEALEAISRRTPDLVLLDVEMPRMNGFDFLASVRGESRFRDLPVVMITSRAAARHRQRANDLNAQGYMVKPYREAELLRFLNRHTRLSVNEIS